MKLRSFRVMKGRDANAFQCLLIAIFALSILMNIHYIYTISSHFNSWISSTKRDGLARVMKYIELEREIDDEIRDEFVDQIWTCLKEGRNSNSLSSGTRSDVVLRSARQVLGRIEANSINPDDISTEKYIAAEARRKQFLDSKPIVNHLEEKYISDRADACAGGNVDVIIALPSSPRNSDRRQKMRSGEIGQFVRKPNNRAKMLFFIGLPTDSDEHSSRKTQDAINAEQHQYWDIVQLGFDDTYKNITKKGVSILRWLSTFCLHANYAIRIDDDLQEVNLTQMTSAMRRTHQTHDHFILGVMRENLKPRREPWNKYFASFEEYPYKRLPDFLLGGSLGYPIKTAGILYEACRRVRPVFWLDDVWVTSMCARRVAVPIFNSPAFYFTHHGERFIFYRGS